MDKSLAVDVVLLPPPDVTRKIISLTSHLPPAPTRLNTADCLPHVSLLMGILKQTDLDKATDILRSLGKGIEDIAITIRHSNNFAAPSGARLSQLVIQPSSALSQLQQKIMEAILPLLSHDDAQLAMFASPPEVAADSTYWLKGYMQHSSGDNFTPHITLGEGIVDALGEPIEFAGCTLALCHLGTYCTCRKVLFYV